MPPSSAHSADSTTYRPLSRPPADAAIVWVLTPFFVLVSVLLGWLCAGYFIVLCFMSFLRKRVAAPIPHNLPTLSIVVRCYNEAELIVDKLHNLLACSYPPNKLEIVFVGGGSNDGTVARIAAAIHYDRSIRIVRSPRKGKIQQLNHVLPPLTGQYLMTATRIAQQVMLPWAAMLWAVIAMTLLTMDRLDLLVVSSASLALLIMIVSRAFRSVAVPPGTTRRYGVYKHFVVFVETMGVLFAAALSYPFFRQTSSYRRVGEQELRERAPAMPPATAWLAT